MEFHAFTAAYLDALRAGDPPTEQHFVSYFSQLLVIKLRARRCDAAEIDEIRQETFVRVLATLRKADALRDATRFGSFVNSVCNNVFLERLRAGRRVQSLDGGGAAGGGGETAGDGRTAGGARPAQIARIAADGIALDAHLVTEEARQRVREVLDGLSMRDRQLLRAIFFDETPKDDICRQFGVDREYLRVLLHRAKQHFRERYRGEPDGRPAARAK